MVLLLRAEELAPFVDMARAIEIVEAAYVEQSQSLAVFHGQFAIPMTPERDRDESGALTGARVRVTSGGLLGAGKIALVTSATSFGSGAGVTLLYDRSDGLVAIMGGGAYGNFRAGAAVAVAAKYLAREDATTVGLIGSGRNSMGLVQGITAVRNVSSIKVYSRSEENRRSFAERAGKAVGMQLETVDEARKAVEGSDIVLVATNSHKPVFDPIWLKKGAYVGSLGRITELDRSLFVTADTLVVGSSEQERTRYYNIYEPIPLDEMVTEGRLSADKTLELGDVVAGKVPGRRSPGDITVFHESQGGFTGAALAAAGYDEARKRGIGLEVEF
jgi:ornithine cyclodeaminase/alanine dehydrogenase-like protein (mu-crystallin family)